MPLLSDYPRYAWQMLNGHRTTIERELADQRTRDISQYINVQPRLRILDVANGRLRPQYTLLKQAGHHVYGIDYVNRPTSTSTDLAYRFARTLYNWQLGSRPESWCRRTLVCGDVGRLPFPDGFFDLAVSAAAFEHFLDVPAVLDELRRVIRPEGMLWVLVHLFTSPSGAHNVSFSEIPLRRVPPGVEPWDHLRRRKLPFTVPLNEWRRDQYLAEFAVHFELLKHYCWTREGEHLLTPSAAAELAAYDQDELTSASYIIVARRPAA